MNSIMDETGHGWVIPRMDRYRANCGGPGVCPDCTEEQKWHGELMKPLEGLRPPNAPWSVGYEAAGAKCSMKKTEHDDAAIRFVSEACLSLTKALGAFVPRWKDMPELHKRLLDLSTQADELACDLDEEFGI